MAADERSEDGEWAIRAVDLAKVYRSGDSDLVVFQNLNLEIRQGEQLAIIGESGCGKSTLLHLLGGLDRPSVGAIHYGHQNIAALNDRELAGFRNKEIGFVWQTHYLLPEFTAIENVMMPLLIRGVAHGEAEPIARTRLEEVGLADRASHRAGELSGGEQQRVVLARALVNRPRVLLADEPTGNLDPRTGEKIISLLADLHRQNQLTSVIVTHNVRFAERCDRIIRMDRGSVASPFTDDPTARQWGDSPDGSHHG